MTVRSLALDALLATVFALALISCKPRPASSPVGGGSTPKPAVLGDLLQPGLHPRPGQPVTALVTDTQVLGERCTLERRMPLMPAYPLLPHLLDSIAATQTDGLADACADPEAPLEGGSAYFLADTGRADGALVSILLTHDVVFPGGKSHTMTTAFHYLPQQGRLAQPHELFTLSPDSLYACLATLCEAQLKEALSQDDLDPYLSDGGRVGRAAIYGTFLITREGLSISIGPSQSPALYWQEPLDLYLGWDTPLPQN